MDEQSPTNCVSVDVDVLAACRRLLLGMLYTAALFLACAVFCTAAIVSQLRQNTRLADLRAERTTAVVVSAVTKGQLSQEVRDYAQDAKAGKDEAHNLVINQKLGIAPAASN